MGMLIMVIGVITISTVVILVSHISNISLRPKAILLVIKIIGNFVQSYSALEECL